MKAQNYSAELTAKIVSDYQSGVDVTDIASAIDKSVRSVRSKLVREGVYVAKPRPTAKKVMGPTKKELLKELESNFGYDVSGLEGATKEAISHLMTVLAQQSALPEERGAMLPFFCVFDTHLAPVQSRFSMVHGQRQCKSEVKSRFAC